MEKVALGFLTKSRSDFEAAVSTRPAGSGG
jgi:hypothetical protein